jgi:hypothetical protein
MDVQSYNFGGISCIQRKHLRTYYGVEFGIDGHKMGIKGGSWVYSI